MNESNYVQLLIDFMEAKAVMLEKLGYKKELYFKEEDAKSLGRWKQERAKEVYYCIKLDILYGVSSRFRIPIYGLGSKTCPFCVDILNRFEYQCSSKCIYGMHHGRCTNKDSDYNTIQSQNNINDRKDIAVVLTNKWYKQLIKKLEKKHLKGE